MQLLNEKKVNMTIQQWESIYDSLYQIESNLAKEYQKAKYGKNRKLRQEGEDAIKRSITLTEHLLKVNPEVYNLLVERFNNSNSQRSFYLDEFFSSEYFKKDLSEFLLKIRAKINTLNSE